MSIPWGIITPVLILQFILVVTALISCLKEERTNGPKWLWIVIIFGLSIIGPILYFSIGRHKDGGGY